MIPFALFTNSETRIFVNSDILVIEPKYNFILPSEYNISVA